MTVRGKFATATVALASAALVCAPAAGARTPVGRNACMGAPHYSYSVKWFVGMRTAHLQVSFPSTCGRQVRAFYAHRSAFGTVVEHGRTVRGMSVSSSVTSRDPFYCGFGWEVRQPHGWHAVTLRTRGRC